LASFRRDFAGAFIRHGERPVAETCRAFVLAGIGCHADIRLARDWRRGSDCCKF